MACGSRMQEDNIALKVPQIIVDCIVVGKRGSSSSLLTVSIGVGSVSAVPSEVDAETITRKRREAEVKGRIRRNFEDMTKQKN